MTFECKIIRLKVLKNILKFNGNFNTNAKKLRCQRRNHNYHLKYLEIIINIFKYLIRKTKHLKTCMKHNNIF